MNRKLDFEGSVIERGWVVLRELQFHVVVGDLTAALRPLWGAKSVSLSLG